MGQRHQLFVIARINGAYQCIVALHHQWLYGTLPLRVAARFMKACSDPFDAQSIKADLYQAANVQANEEDLLCENTPCPFIASFTWGTIFSAGNLDPASMEFMPCDMGSTTGHNNDGITVFDVTDPQNPTYCFINIDELECEGPQPELLTPLTGEQYLRCYYPTPDTCTTPEEQNREQAYQQYIDALQDFGIIEIGQLAEVWPYEYEVQWAGPIGVVGRGGATIQDPLVDIASLSQLSLEVLYDTAGEWPPAEHVLEIGGRALAGHFDVSSGVFDIGDLKVTLRSLVCTADFLIAGHGRVGDLAYYLDMSRFQSDASLSASDMQSISDAFPNLKCINLIGCKQVTCEVIEDHYTNNPSSPLLLNYAEFTTKIDFCRLINVPMRTSARFTVAVRVRESFRKIIRMVVFGQPYLHIGAAITSASEIVTSFSLSTQNIDFIIAWKLSLYSGSEAEPGVHNLSTSLPARLVSNKNAINAGWAFFLDTPQPYTTEGFKYAFVNLDVPTEDNIGFTVENFVERTSSVVRKSLQPAAGDVANFEKALKAQPVISVMSADEVESFRTAVRQPRDMTGH